MEASPTPPRLEPNLDSIKQNLLKRGVNPTPKIMHTLRKKQLQKHNRKLNKQQQQQQQHKPKEASFEETQFQSIKNEYREFNLVLKEESSKGFLVGVPWERTENVKLKEMVSGGGCGEGFVVGKLRRDKLNELREIFEGNLSWVFDDDYDCAVGDSDGFLWREPFEHGSRGRSEREDIGFLVEKLSKREVALRDWTLAKTMKQSGLSFTEGQLLKIVELLGEKGKWKQALAVMEWVYNDKERRDSKSRFVYTKLLSVLGKAHKPQEALQIFNQMLEDCNTYPDMAAYHIISVTLGQAGLVKELVKIVERMQQKPSKSIRNMLPRNWDQVLQPDLVIYNAILNACVPTQQWKGVFWVFEQLRKDGLEPNGATYGLAMEVMLHSRKYNFVHMLFDKMKRRGEAPKALTYKVLVKAFWAEGKVNAAIEAVRDMEGRGVVGMGNVYYELVCCLCNKGRWQDAMVEVEKMKRLCNKRPLEITFTGMILASLDGGYASDCISIYDQMKLHCVPNIGTINLMLKVYGRSDLFSKAKELFEETKELIADKYTYRSMLEASAIAMQWEYFEYVYKEMIFNGYQLDQHKHASLVLHASRAGKTHILEHAFDAILQCGEVPHRSIFTEMVFQATIQQNYSKAVTLVNSMAHTPFHVTEKQWTNLFTRNRNKIINKDSLEMLLDMVVNGCISSEASDGTTSNLQKSLRSLCSNANRLNDPSTSVASDIEETSTSGSLHTATEDNTGLHEDSCTYVETRGDVNSDMDLDADVDEVEESQVLKVPPPDEILETWNNCRKEINFH